MHHFRTPLLILSILVSFRLTGTTLATAQTFDASWRTGVSRWSGSGYVLSLEDQIRVDDQARAAKDPNSLGSVRYLDLTSKTEAAEDRSLAPINQYPDSVLTPAYESSAQSLSQVAAASGGAIGLGAETEVTRFVDGVEPALQRSTSFRDLSSADSIQIAQVDEVVTPAETPNQGSGVDSDSKESSVASEDRLEDSEESLGVKSDVSNSEIEILGIQSRVLSFWSQVITERGWLGGWDSQAELGLDGSSGNASTLGVHTGFETKRETQYFDVELDFDYRQVRNRHETTEDNGRLTSDFDRLFHGESHSAFGKFGMEWDRFKAFDLRLNMNAGYGYHWIRRDDATLVTRFGAGASREIGAPDDQWTPEAVFGLEAERNWSKRQILKNKFEYFPAWEDFGNFRLVGDVSWETILDESDHLRLKLSINNRYDSTPQGARKNDLYYSLLLLYQF